MQTPVAHSSLAQRQASMSPFRNIAPAAFDMSLQHFFGTLAQTSQGAFRRAEFSSPIARVDERNGRGRRFCLLTGVEMCPITKGEMPQNRKHRRLPLPRVFVGLWSMLALAVFVGFLGMDAPRRALAAPHALDRFDLSRSADRADGSMMAGCFVACAGAHEVAGAFVRSQVAQAPAAAVSSTPYESQHPATPLEADAPETGEGSIEAGDDLNDFDDFAYHLRVAWSGTALLNREVERSVSLGGRAVSRLEDNRSDKPPRG
jgi:hypothetical protein